MRKLTLHKPALDDYVDVEKDLNENYRKIEEWANSSGTELDNKFDDGGVSTDYDTAKKMEDKIKFLATQIEKTPIGTILPFASGTIPKDYLLCDGREITKNDYSELYDILPFGGYIDEKVFRGLAKNEVPNMTGPTLNGYTITESSVFSATFPGWKAFDSVISGDNGGWASLTGQKEGWVQIQYPNKRALSSFTIKTRTYAPGSKLEKISVNGVTTTSEDELFTENLSRAFTTNEKREFKVNFNKKTYDKFKIKVSAPNDQYCAIDEIELFTVDITQFPNHKQETTKKYLPDLRGQFLRGIKDGRKLLDWESEDIKKHNHKEPLAYPPESSVTNTLKEYTEVREKKTIFQTLMLDDNVNDNVYGRPIAKETYEGNETRPSNIGVNYIIKAKNGINDNSIPAYIESLLNDLNNLKNNLGANIKDNSISSSKLKTDSDADKIKLANLAEEVINSMSKLTKDSVVREYIADGAVNASKLDNSIYHTEYDVKKESTWNSLGFKLSNALKLNNSNVEFSFVTSYDETKNKPFSFNMEDDSGIPSGIVFKKKIEKLQNGLFKYLFYANNVTRSGIIKFSFGYHHPVTNNLSGKYYDFLLLVDGKPIEFTSAETPEVMNITKVDRKVISYETLINEIYARPITMKDFSEKETLLSTGHSSIDDYKKVIERYTNFNNYYTGILIFQEKFIPGIYKIENNFSGTDYVYIYLFDKANGGNIKEVFKLNKDNQTFILKENFFVGIQKVKNQLGNYLDFGRGIKYNFSSIDGTTVYSKGETAIATNESLSMTSPFNIYRLDIYALKNEQAILDNKKAISQFSKDVAEGSYREISTIPSENLETLMYIDDVLNVEYNKNILINATSNTFTSSNSISYVPYQAIDEWRYKVKFKLLDINTILKFKSINGEWEAGSYIINLGTKEISTGAEQEIMFLPLLEERIGGNIETVSSNAIDISFEVGNFYQIELIRSGLIMRINICDLKNDKIFSWEVTNGKRLHGGLSFGVDSGSIEFKVAHLSTALQKGTKAIFIGDSITEGLGMRTTDISKRWASLLRDNYFKGNALCCGMGWGTTKNVKQVLENIRSYCNYIKYYFIMIGTNQRSEETHVTWKTEIVEIYDTIRNLGGIPVIIVPPLGRVETANAILFKMRDFILEKGWDTIRMDIATSTGDGITFDNSLSTDGTHFNVNGNQKMYERALIDLKKIM